MRALILFFLFCSARTAQAQVEVFSKPLCRTVTRGTVWTPITGNSTRVYNWVFTNLRPTSSNSTRNYFPKFDYATLTSGEKNVLSLGEGDSDFIESLLIKSKNKTQSVAVDAQVPTRFLQRALRNPGHYFQTDFRNLRLVNANDQQILFDEIVSLYALGNVLEIAKENELTEILKPVLAHLKPNGVLRIYPLDSGIAASTIVPLMIELNSHGLNAYDVWITNGPERSGLVIQRRAETPRN